MRQSTPPSSFARHPHCALSMCALLLALALGLLAFLHPGALRVASASATLQVLAAAQGLQVSAKASAGLQSDTHADADVDTDGSVAEKQGPSCCQQASTGVDADSSDRDCLWLLHALQAQPPATRFEAVSTSGPQWSLAPLRRPPRAVA